jgi:hypothetical protein
MSQKQMQQYYEYNSIPNWHRQDHPGFYPAGQQYDPRMAEIMSRYGPPMVGPYAACPHHCAGCCSYDYNHHNHHRHHPSPPRQRPTPPPKSPLLGPAPASVPERKQKPASVDPTPSESVSPGADRQQQQQQQQQQQPQIATTSAWVKNLPVTDTGTDTGSGGTEKKKMKKKKAGSSSAAPSHPPGLPVPTSATLISVRPPHVETPPPPRQPKAAPMTPVKRKEAIENWRLRGDPATKGMMLVPRKWIRYPNMGSPIENLFVPAKTFLDDKFELRSPTVNIRPFTAEYTLARTELGATVGLVINLCDTSDYYDPRTIREGLGVEYVHIPSEAECLPGNIQIEEFNAAVRTFVARTWSRGQPCVPRFRILVHCVTGLVRTGMMIVQNLVSQNGIGVQEAVTQFECSRGDDIRFRDFTLSFLYNELWDHGSESPGTPPPYKFDYDRPFDASLITPQSAHAPIDSNVLVL